jgi:transmembrane sensor
MDKQGFGDRTASPDRDDARSWVVRLASGKLTAEEGNAFRRWHAADPMHASAFAEAKRHWGLIGEAAQALSREAAAPTRRHPMQEVAVTRRRLLLAGAAAATAASVGIAAVRPPFDLWSPLVDLSADYHTGIGQIRTIAVAENVTVQLSTRSRLSLQSDSPDGLRVALLAGEAAIASASRPVAVQAGLGETRAVSGRFNLRIDDEIVRVTCLEGRIEVRCGSEEMTLRPNQQIRYSREALSSVTSADPEEITAWQRGVLVFRNQTLRYVVNEVNRYRQGRIVLVNQELGNRPVTLASFHLDRLDEIIPQMEALYGARARRLPGGIVLLS